MSLLTTWELFSVCSSSSLSRHQIQGAIDTGIPTTISYGFVSGFCSGYALKKVGKVVAVVLGGY
jgi:uncharacterized membrane protein (Fun14 family)